MPAPSAAFFLPITVLRLGLASMLALTLAGCAVGSDEDPGLSAAIRQHYAAHATEEEGACRTPRIDTIQAHRLVERSRDGSEVMMVRYSYFDPHADMDERWDHLVHLSQPCGGIAERRFRLARDDLDYRVVGMEGELRDAVRGGDGRSLEESAR